MLPRALFVLLLTSTGAVAQLDWGSTGAGGTGTWDTSTPNWFNGTSSVTWDGNAAIFGGTAGTVTISNSVQANQLISNTPGYILTGGNLAAAPSSTLNILTNADITIGSTISSGFTKTGQGSLILTNPVSVSSGSINVNGGSLISTSTAYALFGAPVYFNLSNGQLGVAPSGSGADVSDIMVALFSFSGGASVSMDKGANNSVTFKLPISRNSFGDTLVIMPAHGLAALGASEKLVSQSTGIATTITNGMISASIIGQDNDANRSGDFLTNGGSSIGLQVVTYSTSTDINTGSPLLFQASSDQTLTSARSVWALKDNGHTIDLAATTLSINSGGLILNGGTIQNGTLQLGNEGFIYTSLAGGTISSKLSFSTNGLAKFGPGTLTLDGSANPNGIFTVDSGSIDLKTTNSQASFSLLPGTLFTGTGATKGYLAGGLISPGDHVGILTAGSVASFHQVITEGLPNAFTNFAFEFDQTGLPNFAANTASGNDVLRLTRSSRGFQDALTASNEIDLYFNVPFGLQAGQTYYGGFFSDFGGPFDSSIAGANYQVFFSDPQGNITFEGNTYSSYAGGVDISSVAQTADFGSGPVNGYIMQVQVVPEPTSSLLLCAGGALGLLRPLRRKRSGRG